PLFQLATPPASPPRVPPPALSPCHARLPGPTVPSTVPESEVLCDSRFAGSACGSGSLIETAAPGAPLLKSSAKSTMVVPCAALEPAIASSPAVSSTNRFIRTPLKVVKSKGDTYVRSFSLKLCYLFHLRRQRAAETRPRPTKRQVAGSGTCAPTAKPPPLVMP